MMHRITREKVTKFLVQQPSPCISLYLPVLDVRTESEWNEGHIDGAIHVHGGKLQEHFEEVPRDKPVAVVCGSGYRASIAASFLQRSGFDDVSNVPSMAI